MERRTFLKASALGAAGSAIAAPAIAQSNPEVKWRMASSFPRSLDTLQGGCDFVAKRVAELTDGKFQIRVFAGGEIVPGLQVMDAVQAGTVECGSTVSYYYVGKDPAFAFEAALPFGLNARQNAAWIYHGGGMELLREFYKKYNVINFPCGNTGVQMGGWFRKEIKSLKDMEGLKMRIAGIAGRVMAKLGVVPQQVAGGDIYPSLEKGTIDAAEWVGPYDDEKLGFVKVAKYYYYPGFWEGGPFVSNYCNLEHWNKLPKSYQAAFEAACAECNLDMLAKYDMRNAQALKKVVAEGAILKPFPKDVLVAAQAAAFDLYDELAGESPEFAKILPHWKKFRDDIQLWWRVAELNFDGFVLSNPVQGKKK
ncbi:TRAP transporter substrate-binding protein [Magnetospirillum sp. 64-120]|uniref:TRAP transporter substrate-binding protein n=1 Tax=Magnetospirillum sp. 64-120 TaxID=1895778 RepID=UPI000925D28E|nr:TRAP transporter substrate-binding protein [Magnetospirillum sp. 64-120]OJX81067.1 MAG: ABC transporter substrate-binding protein [Magnetospirillum sp. 64-120]